MYFFSMVRFPFFSSLIVSTYLLSLINSLAGAEQKCLRLLELTAGIRAANSSQINNCCSGAPRSYYRNTSRE